MKNLLLIALVLGLFVSLFLFSDKIFQPTKATTETNKTEKKRNDLEKLQKDFAPAKKMLLEYGVSFDPEVLIKPDWQQKISSNLNRMAEGQTTLRTSDKVKGVLIANTVILPERVKLMGDLVIIADSIVFEGKSSKIEGLGKNVYIFPITSTGHLEKTLETSLAKQGLLNKLPAVNERTSEKFNFEFVKDSMLHISVNGQGNMEWRDMQKELQNPNSQMLGYYQQSNGGQGRTGTEGTPGLSGGIRPAQPKAGGGTCTSVMNDGFDGDPARTG